MRPSVFVVSSTESLDIAYAIQENLDYDAEITVWTQGTFTISSNSLDDLVEASNHFDFGVFVFSPDDITKIRGHDVRSIRDNVVFELGLFISKVGRERTFLVVPRGHDDLHLPTDLLGIIPARFNPIRSDLNLQAALGPACNQIRNTIRKLGRFLLAPEAGFAELISRSDVFFHLVNHRSAKSLDVADWRMDNGGRIQQWLYHAGDNQMWILNPVAGHYHYVVSKHSQKCLTVDQGSHQDGASIVQSEYEGKPHQQWTFLKVGDGSYRLVARHSGKCLGIDSSLTGNGADAIQQSIYARDSQHWWLNIHVTSV